VSQAGEEAGLERIPLWVLALAIVAVIAAGLGVLGVFGGHALPERAGPPIEELAVERTVLTPGEIQVVVRNAGPDPVTVAQVFVNDSYVDFDGGEQALGRLGSDTLTLRYPWATGQPYIISMMTSTGLVIEHEIPAAVETPVAGAGFFALMTLLGTYVGIIPVLLGMLVLPLLRRVGRGVVRVLLAITVGLLAFLAVDAALEGFELAASSAAVFGGPILVILGAAFAFLVLTAADRLLAQRRAASERPQGMRLALLIAVGIGLHNLGEGLAIGSAYAVGELALGAALVIGFAVHNTTEGLAIVAPLAHRRPTLPALAGLGLLAGAPAVIGAVVGAAIDNAALAAVVFGVGAGAVIQVIVQLVPAIRSHDHRRTLDPAVLGGVATGVLVMYVTGLFVTA
jgi:ZIP family zinc transporter